MRITEKMLQRKVDYLNKLTDQPETPWTRNEQGEMKSNIGNFHLSHAYGGVCLHQMTNTRGGVRSVFNQGHQPKRVLFDQVCAYIDGIEYAREVSSD